MKITKHNSDKSQYVKRRPGNGRVAKKQIQCLNEALCFLLLLLIFITPSFGQVDGIMFRCGIRDKAGNLWFGTIGEGVYRYDAGSGGFTKFTKQDGLNDNNIESIFEDKAGNLWFSTDNGVCRYDCSRINNPCNKNICKHDLRIQQDLQEHREELVKSFTDLSAKVGLCRFNINCILEDRIGNIWIGSNGWGVSRYNPGTGAVTNFTKEQGLGSDAVQCILEDKAGNLWFGERAGGVCLYDSAAGRFTKVDGDGCFSSQIMDIKEDKAGNIWFVNLYRGLCRYDARLNISPDDYRDGQVKSLHSGQSVFTHFKEENGLCNDTICCMYEDTKGNLWFGSDTKWNTGGGGVCRYDPSAALTAGSKPFVRFSTKDGLSNSDVWTIVEDNDGNIWIGTRGGLYRYHSPSGRFINYTHKLNRQ